MKQILLTLDYELFGNGSGNVFEHMIYPTERMLEIAKKHVAKITFFFEVIEYWRLKEEWDAGNSMGYKTNPITAIEKQICEAVKDGHDVQLHLHPQWVDAKWLNGCWVVNMDDWRLGEYKKVGEDSLDELLRRGKETLEQMIRPIKSDYVCNALRAGGYCIQPSGEIVKSMRKYGFRYDSSVYPGGYEDGQLQRFDFRGLPDDIGWWYCLDKVEKSVSKETEIVELPIVGMEVTRFMKFMSIDRVIGLLKNRGHMSQMLEAKTTTSHKKASLKDKIKFFFQKECQTWDFCLLSKSMHEAFLCKVEEQKERTVFVMVGHPKSLLANGKNMDWLLREMRRRNYQCVTIRDIVL